MFCSGYGFGNSPVAKGNGSTLWVTTFGDVSVDDSDVWRAAAQRSSCTVRSTGLDCDGNTYGPAGDIVDGGNVDGGGRCWLTDEAKVRCTGGSQTEYFDDGKTIFLVYGQYTDSLCAVYNDGSLWCVGSNDQGKLGTGDANDVNVETMVQPPGSVRIECQ